MHDVAMKRKEKILKTIVEHWFTVGDNFATEFSLKYIK
jgi:hypothetical protein